MLLKYKKAAGIAAGALALLLALGYIILPAPSAHGAQKGHTVDIYRNAQFGVIFSEPMNRGSAERAFRLTPSVAGTFQWKGNEMRFRPNAVLEKGSKYEVFVSTEARNFVGKRMKREYRQEFNVLDYPEVAVTSPADGSEVNPSQTLTVLFDHPIRTLSGSLAVPNLLQIQPPVKGQYHWLGTSGFEFVPDDGWTAATDFTVTIPKGTETASGGSLVADFSWKFHTPNLTVRIGSRTDQDSREGIQLDFNYPVHTDALRSALKLLENGKQVPGGELVLKPVKDALTSVLIQTAGGLKLGTSYDIELPERFNGGLGPRGLGETFSRNIKTDDAEFRVAAVCPRSGKKDVREPALIAFNNPIGDDIDLQKLIHISPALKDAEISRGGWSSDTACQGQEKVVSVGGRWNPSTKYTISVEQDAKDIYGQRLKTRFASNVETKPYESGAELASYSVAGMLASHLPRVYQLRTMNLVGPIHVTVCSVAFKNFLRSDVRDPDCDETWTKTFDGAGTLNKYKIFDVDFDAIAGKLLPSGSYELKVDIPELVYGENNHFFQTRTIAVSDTALTLKQDAADQALVWATDMKTGEVVPNLQVEVYARNGYRDAFEKVGQGITDDRGIVFIKAKDIARRTLAVRAIGSARFGFTSSDWSDGIAAWNYGLNQSYAPALRESIGYIYTDRRIYRPDQLVQFKGVLREDVDAKLQLPGGKNAQIEIRNPDGTVVSTQTLPLSAFGTFHGSFQFDPSMPLGTYTIFLHQEEKGGSAYNVSGSFDVREYRRPDFKVAAPEPQNSVFAGEKIEVPVHAEYYYGAPLSGSKVSYQVTRRALYFQPLFGEWYSYSADENTDCWWYCKPEARFETVAEGVGTLDSHGDYRLSIPSNLTDAKSSETYSVTVTVTDVNSRTVSTNLEFPVHKGRFYVGIRPDYHRGWNAEQLDFNLVSVNPDGSVHPGAPIRVTLARRTWSSVKKQGVSGAFWEYDHKDTPVDTKSVMTDGEGKADVSFSPKEGGEYVATAEAVDDHGNTVKASASRYVYRGDGAAFPVSDDHLMKIIQNKADYKPGETASLAVQTPYDHTKALVTIEGKTIREYRVMDLNKENATINVPIGQDATPNVYVSVTAVKGGGDKNIPEFRMGYANLQVNTSNKALQIKVAPDKDVYRPGDKATLAIETKNASGAPVSAEVSVAVVDERVVALLGSIDKDILGKFWFTRAIGVMTSQSLTQLVKKVFFATEGGGGDKGGSDQVPAVRGNLLDTAYWKADVVTDANGKATVSFAWPGNLTSWQIMAIGATKDTIVGSAEAKAVTRRPVMVEANLPRILRHEDRMTLGATVANTTDAAVDLEVSLAATGGVTVEGGAVQHVTVNAHDRKALTWSARVPITGTETKITVRAKGGGYDDGVETVLPILSYSVPEMVTASNIFETRATETLEAPEDARPDAGEVRIAVSPSVGNGLQTGIDYLLEYEYGCSEQTTSAVVSAIVYNELVKKQVSQGDPVRIQKAQIKITEGIKRLAGEQRPDGGFGFWGDSDQSYPFLTAYVFWGLTQAEHAGVAVDQNVMDRADQYLRANLSNSGLGANERAQVLFMLSERNTQGLSGYADTLYDHRSELALFGKAFLAMAYGNLEKYTSSSRAVELLSEIRNKAVYLDPTTLYVNDGSGYDYFMSSNERSTSLYLQALLRLDPGSKDIERAVRYLMMQKHDGYWTTTQATAMSLWGLIEYVKAHPIDASAAKVSVFINNALTNTLDFRRGDVSPEQSVEIPLTSFLKNGTKQQIGLEKESPSRYFYDISMKTYREVADIQPFENGFSIVSDYFALADKKHEHPLSRVSQGDTVRVRVKLLVPKEHQYVALEDHLPAGLEAIDFQLKTSPQNLANKTERCVVDWSGGERCMEEGSMEYMWWWENVWKHFELRDDRVFLFADKLSPGVYEYEFLAQATTPGTFHVPPARVYEFYHPLSNAHNEGKMLTITPN